MSSLSFFFFFFFFFFFGLSGWVVFLVWGGGGGGWGGAGCSYSTGKNTVPRGAVMEASFVLYVRFGNYSAGARPTVWVE